MLRNQTPGRRHIGRVRRRRHRGGASSVAHPRPPHPPPRSRRTSRPSTRTLTRPATSTTAPAGPRRPPSSWPPRTGWATSRSIHSGPHPRSVRTRRRQLAPGARVADPVSAARQYLIANQDLYGIDAEAVAAMDVLLVQAIGTGTVVLLRQRFATSRPDTTAWCRSCWAGPPSCG